MRARDTQRSRVYAWERAFAAKASDGGRLWRVYEEAMTIAECDALARQVWRAERGRYGRAKQDAPAVVPGRGGGNASRHLIRLGRQVRNRYVVLHELAHSMAGVQERHGPRFVGILIGMASRHIAGYDGQAAIELASEMGVRVDVRAVGSIPVLREPTLAEAILEHLPGRVTQVAWRAGIRPAQVRGAALTLIRNGLARYFRGRLVPLAIEAPQ